MLLLLLLQRPVHTLGRRRSGSAGEAGAARVPMGARGVVEGEQHAVAELRLLLCLRLRVLCSQRLCLRVLL